MRTSQFLGSFFYIVLVCSVLCFFGCGGSNLNNPMSDTDQMDETDDVNVEQTGDLDVSVTVPKNTVKLSEQVELSATVEGVRGTSVVINWLNITNYGTLSATNDTSVTWTAPDSLGDVNSRVEVLQLVVTVITEVISVGASEIKTDTQILSDTKEILLQIVSD